MKKFSLSEDIDLIINSISIEANALNNKNIIISGAFGFIGKYMLDCLIAIKKEKELSFEVYAIDNFITSDKIAKSYYANGNKEKALSHLKTALDVWKNADSTYKPAIEAHEKWAQWNLLN